MVASAETYDMGSLGSKMKQQLVDHRKLIIESSETQLQVVSDSTSENDQLRSQILQLQHQLELERLKTQSEQQKKLKWKKIAKQLKKELGRSK